MSVFIDIVSEISSISQKFTLSCEEFAPKNEENLAFLFLLDISLVPLISPSLPPPSFNPSVRFIPHHSDPSLLPRSLSPPSSCSSSKLCLSVPGFHPPSAFIPLFLSFSSPLLCSHPVSARLFCRPPLGCCPLLYSPPPPFFCFFLSLFQLLIFPPLLFLFSLSNVPLPPSIPWKER